MMTCNLMDTREWDALVKKVYGRMYDFQQQDGCRDRGTFRFTVPDEPDDYENDSVPEEVNHREMGVSFKAWLSRDPSKPLSVQKDDWQLTMWWERNFYPDIQMIANDLHEKGHLAAGEYLIDIDW